MYLNQVMGSDASADAGMLTTRAPGTADIQEHLIKPS